MRKFKFKCLLVVLMMLLVCIMSAFAVPYEYAEVEQHIHGEECAHYVELEIPQHINISDYDFVQYVELEDYVEFTKAWHNGSVGIVSIEQQPISGGIVTANASSCSLGNHTNVIILTSSLKIVHIGTALPHSKYCVRETTTKWRCDAANCNSSATETKTELFWCTSLNSEIYSIKLPDAIN